MFEKEGFAEMYKIVCSMMSRPESLAFREPVDWKGLGLLDYLDIVKHPMDLGTVKTRIENEKYSSLDDIAFDIQLVWRNCMLYNRDGSEVILHPYFFAFLLHGNEPFFLPLSAMPVYSITIWQTSSPAASRKHTWRCGGSKTARRILSGYLPWTRSCSSATIYLRYKLLL